MEPQSAIKHGADVAAYTGVVATLMGWLPAIAALLSIIWLAIQITEKILGRSFHDMILCIYRRLTSK